MITILGPPLAPPVELARWILEVRDIPHDFQPLGAGLSAITSRRHDLPVELPIILTDTGAVGGAIGGLRAGFGFVSGSAAGHAPPVFDKALVASLFDGLFSQGVRTFYVHMLEAPAVLVPLATGGVPASHRWFIKTMFGTWRRAMRQGLKLDSYDGAAVLAELHTMFDRVAALIPPGQAFLGGDSPGVEDRVFAALASPVVLPDGHPVALPDVAELPDALQDIVLALRAHAAGQLAQLVYRTRHGGQAANVATPRGQGGMVARIAAGQAVPQLAARIGARLAGKPWRFGTTVLVVRHAEAREVLVRDTDFLIAPVNATRIEAVCGPFVLGMDRGTVQQRERAALYAGLAAVDQDALLLAAGHDADDLLAGVHGIDAVAGYARIVAGRTAQRLFGISGMDAPLFRDVVRAVFGHTFLNLGGDAAIEARALRAAALMRGWFEAEIARRRQSGVPGEDMMGQLLRQGTLDDDGVRRTLSGMLVGSIDTTATCVAKILSVMAQDSELTERATAAEPAPLYGYCLEALRRWPHNPILMRVAARDTMLGGRRVEAGDKVIVWTQAAMQDRKAFAQPRRMLPRAERDYLHFGSELHVCAGHDVNRWQIPLLVGRVLRRGYAIDGAMGWAGPFPDHLPIRLD